LEILGPELNHRLGDSVQATWTEPPLWCRWVSPLGLGHRWGGGVGPPGPNHRLGSGGSVHPTGLIHHFGGRWFHPPTWTAILIWGRWFSPSGLSQRFGAGGSVRLDRTTAWGYVSQSTWTEPPLGDRWFSPLGSNHRFGAGGSVHLD
jgi:hypothetical protein